MAQLHVEADGTARAIGNIAEVAEARALVSFLDVGIGPAHVGAGRTFHAVDEIPLVNRAIGLAGVVEVGARVTLDDLEAEHIRRILAATPTVEEAASVLGIDPSTLYRKRKRYGL